MRKLISLINNPGNLTKYVKFDLKQGQDLMQFSRKAMKFHLAQPKRVVTNLKDYFSSMNEFKNMRESIEYNPYKVSHLKLVDSPLIDPAHRGKAFIKDKPSKLVPKPLLREANSDDLNNSFNFISGGMDFDSMMHMAALLKYEEKLASLTPSNDNLQDHYNSVVIFPEVPREERYQAMANFNLAPDEYPDYIVSRVKKYILPKIINEQGQITPPKVPITFFSFSVGGRETFMIERALIDILKNNYSLSSPEISKLFDSFKGVCLAYAIDPSTVFEDGFSKIIFFAADDRGVLIPAELNRKYISTKTKLYEEEKLPPNLINSEEAKDPYRLYDITPKDGIHKQLLVIVKQGQMFDNVEGKITTNYHSLPHYVETIKEIMPKSVLDEVHDMLIKPIEPPDFNVEKSMDYMGIDNEFEKDVYGW